MRCAALQPEPQHAGQRGRASRDAGRIRRALTGRIKKMAGETPWTLPQLQRQVAYDRLLERLYLVDDGWIVKGATALLARDLSVGTTTWVSFRVDSSAVTSHGGATGRGSAARPGRDSRRRAARVPRPRRPGGDHQGRAGGCAGAGNRDDIGGPAPKTHPGRTLRRSGSRSLADGYAAEARRSLLDRARTLGEALAAVRPFIDPIFDGSATGRWNPRARRWSAP
jgi:hypothetical protein